MVKIILSLVLLVTCPCAFTFAQTTSSDHSPINFYREYLFTIKGTSKKNPTTATLKLSEKKDMVYLFFEGSELKSGEYKIYKARSCADIKKLVRSKKPLIDENELYSFETKYGNISGERNLPFKNFQELGGEDVAFALIKMERKSRTLASCTSKNTARNANMKEITY